MPLGHSIFKLKGVVQHYSWGGYDFIPQLLGIENEDKKPFAEYWMGAHGNHPSLVQNDETIPLNDFIKSDIEGILGNTVSTKFSTLPYLLKVLDVRQMLSIQVHPSKKAAEHGFEEENKKNIPVNAPHRNYKDANHKPESMVALSDFWLLHGFKKKEDLEKILDAKTELHFLKEIFFSKGYKGLYEEVMLMDQHRVNDILKPLVQKIIPLYKNESLPKSSEDFWAAKAALNFCKGENFDRGIFSIYFFNLVSLKKGQGIFQADGLPHAYLEGQNVEIMSNSDNVLRSGLTDKHIDVAELLKHVKFEATIPDILNPQSHRKIFISPAEEYELQQYLLNKGDEEKIETRSGEIFLLLEGSLEAISGNEKMQINKGDSIFIKAGCNLTINPLLNINLFRATIPVQ
jgi:mannose-6-phosphate isomerase